MAMGEFRRKLLNNRNVCLVCKQRRGEVLFYGVMVCKNCLHQAPLRNATGGRHMPTRGRR